MEKSSGLEEPFGLKDYSDGTPTVSVDPVCGRSVDEAQAAAKTDYEGQRYYFCSKECQNNFELDPAGYVARFSASR